MVRPRTSRKFNAERDLRESSEDRDDVRSPINFNVPHESCLTCPSSCLAGRPRPASTIQHVVIARAKRMDPAATVLCSAVQEGKRGEGGEEGSGGGRGEESERITNRPSGGEFFSLSVYLLTDRQRD